MYYYIDTVLRLHVEPRSPEPIWSQIEAGVRRLVASRSLQPGQALPSVRDLARELRVNPATVSKAYQRLTDAGLLEVRRGDGTYVAERPPTRAGRRTSQEIREAATRYATLGLTTGLTVEEAQVELRAAWRRLSEGEEGS